MHAQSNYWRQIKGFWAVCGKERAVAWQPDEGAGGVGRRNRKDPRQRECTCLFSALPRVQGWRRSWAGWRWSSETGWRRTRTSPDWEETGVEWWDRDYCILNETEILMNNTETTVSMGSRLTIMQQFHNFDNPYKPRHLCICHHGQLDSKMYFKIMYNIINSNKQQHLQIQLKHFGVGRIF